MATTRKKVFFFVSRRGEPCLCPETSCSDAHKCIDHCLHACTRRSQKGTAVRCLFFFLSVPRGRLDVLERSFDAKRRARCGLEACERERDVNLPRRRLGTLQQLVARLGAAARYHSATHMARLRGSRPTRSQQRQQKRQCARQTPNTSEPRVEHGAFECGVTSMTSACTSSATLPLTPASTSICTRHANARVARRAVRRAPTAR